MLNENILSFENLWKSSKKVFRNVRWKGSVTKYEINCLKNCARMRHTFHTDTYKISEYREFEIYEPKRRKITSTMLVDRHIQRSICDNYLYDELTKHFIYDNCACQIGKGTDFAINRLKCHLQKYYRKHKNEGWYLKCDIHHFFESIDHDIAKKIIDKLIKDKSVVSYVSSVIDSFGDVGIGLGSQISQLIALSYLNEMDHIIKEKFHIKYYVRYMDDFILIDTDKSKLKQCRDYINSYLNSIGLTLNKKTMIQRIKFGIVFLNWKFSLSETGKVYHTQIKSKIFDKKRKLRNMIKSNNLDSNTVDKTFNGMIKHLEKGNSYNLITYLNKYYNKLKSTCFTY
jgi:hypothetical protein